MKIRLSQPRLEICGGLVSNPGFVCPYFSHPVMYNSMIFLYNDVGQGQVMVYLKKIKICL